MGGAGRRARLPSLVNPHPHDTLPRPHDAARRRPVPRRPPRRRPGARAGDAGRTPSPPRPTRDPSTRRPPPDDAAADVAATLEADGRFTTLLGALAATGLDTTLAEGGPYTLFAPTDDAFAALPEGALDALSGDDLRTLLLYHVVEGDVAAASDEPVATLAGPTLDLADVDGEIVLNGGSRRPARAWPVSNGARLRARVGPPCRPPPPTTATCRARPPGDGRPRPRVRGGAVARSVGSVDGRAVEVGRDDAGAEDVLGRGGHDVAG